MLPSSVLCREQETIHKAIATTAPLPNVRLIAETAAAAWAHEAIAADRREARQARLEATRAGLMLQEPAAASPPDRNLGENTEGGASSQHGI